MNIEQFAVELLSKITNYPSDRVVRGSLKVNMLDPAIEMLNKFKSAVIAEYVASLPKNDVKKVEMETAKAKPLKKVKEDAKDASADK